MKFFINRNYELLYLSRSVLVNYRHFVSKRLVAFKIESSLWIDVSIGNFAYIKYCRFAECIDEELFVAKSGCIYQCSSCTHIAFVSQRRSHNSNVEEQVSTGVQAEHRTCYKTIWIIMCHILYIISFLLQKEYRNFHCVGKCVVLLFN